QLVHQYGADEVMILTAEAVADALVEWAALDREGLRRLDELVPGRGRRVRVEADLLEHVLVVEERQRAHGRREPVVLTVDLHRLHHGDEVALDPLVRQVLLRERLDVTGPLPGCDVAVEELDYVRPLARAHRGGDALLIRIEREGLLADDDLTFVLGVELLDEHVHRLHARVEYV